MPGSRVIFVYLIRESTCISNVNPWGDLLIGSTLDPTHFWRIWDSDPMGMDCHPRWQGHVLVNESTNLELLYRLHQSKLFSLRINLQKNFRIHEKFCW